MKSFLDGEETWDRFIYAGLDPDLHHTGFVTITVEKSSKSRKRILWVTSLNLTVSDKLKGLDAVHAMIERLTCRVKNIEHIDYALVESQQSYYKDNDSRAKIVGQANDLIMLATISGAASSVFMAKGADVQIKLPAQWKGQRKKENMHRKARDILEAAECLNTKILDDMCGHEMDALCMALTGAGYHV